jgi:hypothetical protein
MWRLTLSCACARLEGAWLAHALGDCGHLERADARQVHQLVHAQRLATDVARQLRSQKHATTTHQPPHKRENTSL